MMRSVRLMRLSIWHGMIRLSWWKILVILGLNALLIGVILSKDKEDIPDHMRVPTERY